MMRPILVVAMLAAAPHVQAGLDRAGNVIRDDDGGGSSNAISGMAMLGMLAWLVACTYVIFRFLEKRTGYSSAANGNIAFVAALISCPVVFSLVR